MTFILGSLLLDRRNNPGRTPVSECTVQFLSAIAHKKRILILAALLHEEMSVSALLALTGLSPSALSQHLMKLRQQRLISGRRAINTKYYRICSPCVEPMLEVLHALISKSAARPWRGKRLI